MKWLNLAAYKPAAGAGVASTPIANGLQAIQDAINSATIAGAPIASAATIAITNPFHQITGTTPIANIGDANTPTQGETVSLWAQSSVTIQNNGSGTGNIRTRTGNDRVLVANEIITLVFDGALWRESGPGIGGAIVGTKVSDLGTGYEGAQARLRLMPTTFNTGGATALPAATITVSDTTEFPSVGSLDCGANGTVAYTGKTATTFTGCTGGTGTLAANVTVRLLPGSGTPTNSSFDEVMLVYDSTLGKWVSPVEAVSFDGGQANVSSTTTSATFAEMLAFGISGPAIPWRAKDAAGLKPQLRVHGCFINTIGANASAVCPSFDGANVVTAGAGVSNGPRNHNGGDAAASSPLNTVGTANFAAPYYTLWGNIPGGYTVYDMLQPGVQAKTAGGSTFTLSVYTWELRWVG